MTAVIYYLLFRGSILLFNLKTPGRIIGETSGSKGLIAIINALGGKANIVDISACLTRLRISVKSADLVNKSQLSQLGAKGVVILGNGVQVVYGTKAESIRRLLNKYIDRHN